MEPLKTDSGAYLIRKKLRTKSVANIQIILNSKILMTLAKLHILMLEIVEVE